MQKIIGTGLVTYPLPYLKPDPYFDNPSASALDP